MDQALKELGKYVQDTLGDAVTDITMRLGELSIEITATTSLRSLNSFAMM